MKNRFLFLFSILFLAVSGCQGEKEAVDSAPPSSSGTSPIASQIVEASCGECQFGMPGKGCDLAVRIDGMSYFVDGSSIDDHGDAHSESGMCNCIRKARVTGEIKGDRFSATSFKLLPLDKEQVEKDRQNKLKKSRLGASFAMKGKTELFVHDVWVQGLAGKSGLQKGDQIVVVNGKPAADLDHDSLKLILDKESAIVFGIKRDGESLEIKVDASK